MPRPSFAERQRLFELPRSSWADYDTALISRGRRRLPAHAEVHRRSRRRWPHALGLAKSVDDDDPGRADPRDPAAPRSTCCGTAASARTSRPRPRTNLEWATAPTTPIRVDGDELRVKVVGEGGNLGLTQLGRIEAALAGVRINTDAIDNSAGVDTSDHEVNIKILLGEVVRGRRSSRSSSATSCWRR